MAGRVRGKERALDARRDKLKEEDCPPDHRVLRIEDDEVQMGLRDGIGQRAGIRSGQGSRSTIRL